MKDKDIIKITELIADKFNFYILTKPQIERAAEPEIIRSALLKNNIPPNRIICTKNVNEALSVAQQLNQNTLFAGSFYLIGEILSN
jgi:folylpolyglutamate synthase/dihydropteroate synthase